MKQKWTSGLMALLSVALVIGLAFDAFAESYESKYSTTGTNAVSLTFGPVPYGQILVKGLYAKSDKATAVLKFYSVGSEGMVTPTASPTSGAQVVSIENPAHAISTNDYVAYCHVSGAVDITTVAESATNSITLTTGVSEAGATGDQVYHLELAYQLPVGSTAALNPNGDFIYATPGNSPLYMLLDCSTNAALAATAIK